MDIEGIKSPENLNINLNAEARIAKFSLEMHKLSKNEKIYYSHRNSKSS